MRELGSRNREGLGFAAEVDAWQVQGDQGKEPTSHEHDEGRQH